MRSLPPAQPREGLPSRPLPVEATRRLLRRGAYSHLARLLRKFHSSECAEIVAQLTPQEQGRLLERLPDLELATSIFAYLEDSTRAELLPHLSTTRLVEFIRLLPPDDAVDILGAMPKETLSEILAKLPEPLAAEIRKLLAYDPQTAGGLMTTNYIALEETCTVAEALQRLRQAGQAETVFYLYVVDAEHRLVGVVSLRQLVMAEPETRLRDLMETEVIRVGVDEDQEQIARLITQYDFLALPVVDASGRLVGIVTVDDIIDVISEEATEDMLRMAGVNPDEVLDASSRRTIRNRLPWLAASCFGAFLASYVIDANRETLQRLVILAAYFPLINGLGGNTASQSFAVAVRGLATGLLSPKQFGQELFKGLRIGLSLGFMFGVAIGAVAYLRHGMPLFGFIVGSAVCASLTIAALIGGLLPLLFARLRIDPAIATGPFLATSMDIIALSIYLTIAKLFLLS
ncbi:MAG: magnesium transporter MgtE [Candidatus Tectimicrobiota bacterium]|nr:MAG: magnesium transporter MgtE [Candidatus Tectomicrobia bacterium]